ncbi:hypothetical protein LXL04_004177 [Taraxacum kok-saghyz]
MTFSVNEILAPSRCVSKSRLAFTQVQEQLDHVLFKMAPTGIRTEERLDHSFLQRRDGGLRRRDEEALPSVPFVLPFLLPISFSALNPFVLLDSDSIFCFLCLMFDFIYLILRFSFLVTMKMKSRHVTTLLTHGDNFITTVILMKKEMGLQNEVHEKQV